MSIHSDFATDGKKQSRFALVRADLEFSHSWVGTGHLIGTSGLHSVNRHRRSAEQESADGKGKAQARKARPTVPKRHQGAERLVVVMKSL